MTSLEFLGGCKTIGGSAYLVRESDSAILLDYGAYFNGFPKFPQIRMPNDLTVILSHAHLDHSGGLPFLFVSGSVPVYMTAITRDLIRILLKDMLRLSQYYLPYERLDLDRLLRRIEIVDYGEPVALRNGFTFTLHDAGHIPGSAAVQVETNKERILYTGDINTIDTQLLKGAQLPRRKSNTLIIESTYALTSHQPRLEIEQNFIETVNEVVDGGGVVLVPAFAVARAQEILAVLTKYKVSHPIYLDGMAREASRVFLRHPPFFRNYQLLKRALKKTEWIQNHRQRDNVLANPGIMVAPAGMLRGGTAAMYLSQIMHDPKNAVLLVGYQIPGTPGRDLLENGKYDAGSGLQRVKAQVQLFDFSSHAGQDQLLELGNSFSKTDHIYAVHGETQACNYLADTLRKHQNLNALAVDIGQQVTLSNDGE